jgi:hypothetical protein
LAQPTVQKNTFPIESDGAWATSVRSAVEKFIEQGANALSKSELNNLKCGLQEFSLQCKRRKHLAKLSKDTLPIVRMILSAIGGAIEH